MQKVVGSNPGGGKTFFHLNYIFFTSLSFIFLLFLLRMNEQKIRVNNEINKKFVLKICFFKVRIEALINNRPAP